MVSKKRKISFSKKDALIRFALVFAILILLNVVSRFFFYRLDLTSEKRFSISAPTKAMVKNLKDVVTVKVIEFNKEDRRILVSHTRYLEDLKYKAENAVRAERSKEEGEEKAAIADVQKKVEKETLGDLAALAALKESLEK